MHGTSPPGSGALSHAYLQYPPLQFHIPGAAGLMYDDGNKLILVPAPHKVMAWAVNQKFPPGDPSVTNFVEGPIRFARFSLDATVLAIQRSGQDVEFIKRDTGATFSQRCRQGTDQIFGFFWTDCPACDVVFITSSGLELYVVDDGRSGLKLVDVKKLNVSWYVYTHESRLVLLASGMQCKTLSGFQFAAGGIIRLPKFDAVMAKAEYNSKPVLCREDIHICTMYGRLYCLQVDRVAMEMRLYRFYRDAVEPQGFLSIYSGNVAVSVVDNVLLIHEIDSKVVLLYDIVSDSKVPISAPLTLFVRGLPSNTSSRAAFESGQSQAGSISDVNNSDKLAAAETMVYDSGWIFANPNIIVDCARGLLWKLRLDLEAIAASSSDLLSLLAFLQRRSQEPSQAKLLSVDVVRSMIIERQPLPLLARAMDVLTSSYARANDFDKYPSKRLTHENHLAGSRVSAAFEVPREFDISAATLPDSVLQAVQKTSKGRKEPSVVYMDVEAGATAWVQAGSDNAGGNSRDATSTIDVRSLTSSSAPEHSSTTSKAVDTEIDIVSSHSHSSVREEYSGRPSQRSQADDFVADCGEVKGDLSPSISPEEMHLRVFYAIEKDMVIDSTFLVANIIQYIRSAAAEHVRVTPGLYVLMIQILAQQQQYYELWHLTVGKILPPSKAVAMQLLEVGAQNTPTRRLGMDMLRQLHGGHTDYINFLLQEGRISEAVGHVRQSKVKQVKPAAFLAAAKDSQQLASVFRFCLECIPNFRETSEFSMYLSTLRHQFLVSNNIGSHS